MLLCLGTYSTQTQLTQHVDLCWRVLAVSGSYCDCSSNHTIKDFSRTESQGQGQGPDPQGLGQGLDPQGPGQGQGLDLQGQGQGQGLKISP